MFWKFCLRQDTVGNVFQRLEVKTVFASFDLLEINNIPCSTRSFTTFFYPFMSSLLVFHGLGPVGEKFD